MSNEQQQSAPCPRLLSVDEVVALWPVDASTVRRWARDGRLPAVKLSATKWAFTEQDLRQFIESRRTGTDG